jgi:hypothetical protein
VVSGSSFKIKKTALHASLLPKLLPPCGRLPEVAAALRTAGDLPGLPVADQTKSLRLSSGTDPLQQYSLAAWHAPPRRSIIGP